jgi:hypothetical protein
MKNPARFPGRAWTYVIHAVGQVVVFAKPSRLTALSAITRAVGSIRHE